jgi:hypothetical protein
MILFISTIFAIHALFRTIKSPLATITDEKEIMAGS